MAFDFPASPAVNDIYEPVTGGQKYKWRGDAWIGYLPSFKTLPPPNDGAFYMRRDADWSKLPVILKDEQSTQSGTQMASTGETSFFPSMTFRPLLPAGQSKIYAEWNAYGTIDGEGTTDDYRGRMFLKYLNFNGTAWVIMPETVCVQGGANYSSNAVQIVYPMFAKSTPLEVPDAARNSATDVILQLWGQADYASDSVYCYTRYIRIYEVQV